MKYINLFLAFLSAFSMFAQELKNHDQIVFERGVRDTVYVLQEHASYNLVRDANGCVRKDSIVCRSLEGLLVIPEDFRKRCIDTMSYFFGYDYKKAAEKFREISNRMNYLNLWQSRGERIHFFDKVYKRKWSWDMLWASYDYTKRFDITISRDGLVSLTETDLGEEKRFRFRRLLGSVVLIAICFLIIWLFFIFRFENLENKSLFWVEIILLVLPLSAILGLILSMICNWWSRHKIPKDLEFHELTIWEVPSYYLFYISFILLSLWQIILILRSKYFKKRESDNSVL